MRYGASHTHRPDSAIISVHNYINARRFINYLKIKHNAYDVPHSKRGNFQKSV